MVLGSGSPITCKLLSLVFGHGIKMSELIQRPLPSIKNYINAVAGQDLLLWIFSNLCIINSKICYIVIMFYIRYSEGCWKIAGKLLALFMYVINIIRILSFEGNTAACWNFIRRMKGSFWHHNACSILYLHASSWHKNKKGWRLYAFLHLLLHIKTWSSIDLTHFLNPNFKISINYLGPKIIWKPVHESSSIVSTFKIMFALIILFLIKYIIL